MFWTRLHAITILPAFALFIILAVLITRLLKNKSERIQYIPFQIIACTLLVLEVLKQINSIDFETGAYNTYPLPFHYCSLFLYLFPLHAFYKGKHKCIIDAITFACGSSLTLFMLVIPTIVYGESSILEFTQNFSSFHTVIFHNLAMFYVILMLAMRMHKTSTRADLAPTTVFLAIYVIIAAILSNTLKVNFHNLYQCNLAPIESIRQILIEKIGYAGGQMIYTVVMFIGTILFAYIAYFAARFVMYLIDKIFFRRPNREISNVT